MGGYVGILRRLGVVTGRTERNMDAGAHRRGHRGEAGPEEAGAEHGRARTVTDGHGRARTGTDGHGRARMDTDGHGRTRTDTDGHGRARTGTDGHGRTRTDTDGHGRTRTNTDGHGRARTGTDGHGRTRTDTDGHGRARTDTSCRKGRRARLYEGMGIWVGRGLLGSRAGDLVYGKAPGREVLLGACGNELGNGLFVRAVLPQVLVPGE